MRASLENTCGMDLSEVFARSVYAHCGAQMLADDPNLTVPEMTVRAWDQIMDEFGPAPIVVVDTKRRAGSIVTRDYILMTDADAYWLGPQGTQFVVNADDIREVATNSSTGSVSIMAIDGESYRSCNMRYKRPQQ